MFTMKTQHTPENPGQDPALFNGADASFRPDPETPETPENEDEPADWGDVDPLDPPMSIPDPMDPSGPGSAV